MIQPGLIRNIVQARNIGHSTILACHMLAMPLSDRFFLSLSLFEESCGKGMFVVFGIDQGGIAGQGAGMSVGP
jgi:hypothetical protein